MEFYNSIYKRKKERKKTTQKLSAITHGHLLTPYIVSAFTQSIYVNNFNYMNLVEFAREKKKEEKNMVARFRLLVYVIENWQHITGEIQFLLFADTDYEVVRKCRESLQRCVCCEVRCLCACVCAQKR